MEKSVSNKKEIFLSYWQAGYEGADHINCVGQPLSMNHATRHDARAYDDYRPVTGLRHQDSPRKRRLAIGRKGRAL